LGEHHTSAANAYPDSFTDSNGFAVAGRIDIAKPVGVTFSNIRVPAFEPDGKRAPLTKARYGQNAR
jgi:hypothetical protein